MGRTLTEAEMQMLALDPEALSFQPWVSMAQPEQPEEVDFPFFQAIDNPQLIERFA